MNQEFDVIIERDAEDYYVASVPALPGCHTQAKSLDELMSRVTEAIELYLDTESVEIDSLRFVGIQKVMVAR